MGIYTPSENNPFMDTFRFRELNCIFVLILTPALLIPCRGNPDIDSIAPNPDLI